MALMITDIVRNVNAAFGQNVVLHVTPELDAIMQACSAVEGLSPFEASHVTEQGAATQIRNADAIVEAAAPIRSA